MSVDIQAEAARMLHEYVDRDPIAQEFVKAWGKKNEEAEQLRDALIECEEYFDVRADADCVGDPPRRKGNEEMRLLVEIRTALGKTAQTR